VLLSKLIKTWTVRPVYKILKGKKKIKLVPGMIMSPSRDAALKLMEEYKASGLEASVNFEELSIKTSEDENE
jgi:hypothetical protein